jgi:peroxiredoxin Q/BCP
MALKIGDTCPTFSLPDQHGEMVTSNDIIGKNIVVLFFYPKDETPGCTKEACSFRDMHESFVEAGCQVVGISSDSVKAHKKFAEKFQLQYTLLADTKKSVRKAFDVPGNLFGLIPGRVTYIIDKQGIIQGIHNSQTDPVGHIHHAWETVKNLIS